MADEARVIKQDDGDHFRVALQGQDPDECPAPVRHDGRLVHEGRAAHPVVHMVHWDEGASFVVRHGGEVLHVGDKERPVPLDMRHSSPEGPVALDVRPLHHGLRVETGVCEPIHHALQIHTPLQVRFVNPWEAASDYRVSFRFGRAQVLEIRLTGKTLLTPRGALEDACASGPDVAGPRVQAMVDLLGRRDTL